MPFSEPSSECLLAREANVKLHSLYEPFLEEWKTLYSQETARGFDLSVPCFVKAVPEYFAASRRLFFVGQETHGWATHLKPETFSELTVKEIMDFHAEIKPKLWSEYPSPYWQAVKQIATQLQPSLSPSSILFANLFPCDVNKGRPPQYLHDILRARKLLAHELEILQPDSVIFFCGPIYFYTLKNYFREMPNGTLSRQTPILRYKPRTVSWNGLISYHPNYLRRSKQWEVLDAIESLLNY